jgi:predicted RNA-binding protein Jag
MAPRSKAADISVEPDETADSDAAATASAADGERSDKRAGGSQRGHDADGDDNMTERAELGVVITRRLCELIGVGVDDVTGDVQGDTVVICIDGVATDNGTLDSRAFESMQFLLNKAVHRSGGRRSRLSLRVDGFRSRRREPLDRLAQALAQKAQRLGKVLTLGPVDATDARTWTVALQRQPGTQVATVGPNESRRIVIAPEGVETDAAGRGRRRRRRRRKG